MKIKYFFPLVVIPIMSISSIFVCYILLMNFDGWYTKQNFTIIKKGDHKKQTIKIKPSDEFLNALKLHGWYSGNNIYRGYMGGYEYVVW